MKLLKKTKSFIAFILVASLITQPLLLQAEHSIITMNRIDNNVHDDSINKNEANLQSLDVSPTNLSGLHLIELVRMIIAYAFESNSSDSLPHGLINCCKNLENGDEILPIEDLIEAVPYIIEKVSDPIMIEMLTRAPRPDAANSNAMVGPLVCDVSEILAILNTLLNKINQCCQGGELACCDELLADFDATFAALEDITATLTDCCATIQNNFNDTFTAIAAISTTTVMIAVDFSPIFTVLNDINNTLTTCCANITNEFNGTFTALNTINNNVLATFTALSDISNTLTECCASIEINFNGTFTAIAAIDTSFDATFTAIADVRNTLTACCASIANNFNGTFTAIAAISTGGCDLTPVFTVLSSLNTTLTACCASIANNFNGTFTAIAAISTGGCDLTPVFTVLSSLNTTLTECCANITVQFNSTFTAIDAGFNATFTVLANLGCTTTPIFTPITITEPGSYCLANDIAGAINIDADNVTLDLNFHTISGGDINVNPGTNRIIQGGNMDGGGIFTTTGCNNTIVRDLSIANNPSFAISFLESCTNCVISNILIINGVSGIRFDQNSDQAGAGIVIENFSISNITGPGISLSFCQDAIIRNGIIDNVSTDAGIFLLTCTNLQIVNVIMSNIPQQPGIFATDINAAYVNEVTINQALNGFSFNNTNNCLLSNCRTFSTVNGVFFLNSHQIQITDCIVQNLNHTSAGGTQTIAFHTGTPVANVQFIDCTAHDIRSINTPVYGFFINSRNSSLDNCLVQTASGILAVGYDLTGTNILVTNCKANNCINTQGVPVFNAGGFLANNNAISIQNCESAFNQGRGFWANMSNVLIGNSVAFNNTQEGFLTTGTRVYHCVASGNTPNFSGPPNVTAASAAAIAGGNFFI